MKIHLNEMVFYGYHGVHPEERKLGQRFIVDLTVESDSALDSKIKHLSDTIDYTKVFAEIKHVMEKKQFVLLENCANCILDDIFAAFDLVCKAKVIIRKPSVPINGSLSSVEVEMQRSR
ncbi:MAG: dihydroneopterin aldolase [Candidatus Cloacimonetes bacterium]|nr:dihydroneopterin aldolase [Candidatus Cloacimonadota bacterium]